MCEATHRRVAVRKRGGNIEERVGELAEVGISQREIGRRLKIDQQAVRYHLHNLEVKKGLAEKNTTTDLKNLTPEVRKNLKNFEKNYAKILGVKLEQILNSFSSETIKLLDPRDRISLFKALDEKKRLEEGKATRIVNYEQLQKEIKALEKEEEELKNKIVLWEKKKSLKMKKTI